MWLGGWGCCRLKLASVLRARARFDLNESMERCETLVKCPQGEVQLTQDIYVGVSLSIRRRVNQKIK